jgi:tRNA-dihydrouridine synthase A
MQSTGAVLHKPERTLHYSVLEQPLALQVGGSDPDALAQCAHLAEEHGFAELNLNLGCPSDKVQAGRFGACLMKEPQRVVECLVAMKQASNLPITVKTRIGVDDHEGYAFFASFVEELIKAGCDKVIVHARKALLKGLNPKQNRTVPPLHYDYVYRVKSICDSIPVVLNGQVLSVAEVHQHLQHIDGVMIGRLAYQHPYAIAEIHHALYPEHGLASRMAVLENYLDYAEQALKQAAPKSLLLKPLFNFAHGLVNAKRWKNQLMNQQQSQQPIDAKSLLMLMSELVHFEGC